MGNCDVVTTVDFGKGPVEVRCTEVAEHTEHRCLVYISQSLTHNRHNVFEGDNDGG